MLHRYLSVWKAYFFYYNLLLFFESISDYLKKGIYTIIVDHKKKFYSKKITKRKWSKKATKKRFLFTKWQSMYFFRWKLPDIWSNELNMKWKRKKFAMINTWSITHEKISTIIKELPYWNHFKIKFVLKKKV